MTISIKTAADVEGMRVAGRLASEVLDMLTPHVVAGVAADGAAGLDEGADLVPVRDRHVAEPGRPAAHAVGDHEHLRVVPTVPSAPTGTRALFATLDPPGKLRTDVVGRPTPPGYVVR